MRMIFINLPVTDVEAATAFYAGLVRALAAQDRPVWSQMSFAAAADNFAAGTRHGLETEVYWPGVGQCPVAELVVRRLLPLAADGLRRHLLAGVAAGAHAHGVVALRLRRLIADGPHGMAGDGRAAEDHGERGREAREPRRAVHA